MSRILFANSAQEQTMICRQLFAGHVVGSRPMKRKKNLQWMIITIILLCCSLPVPLSLADTLTIPLASISNVTSTWGTPRGAGGIPTCNEPCQTHRKGRVIFYYCTLMAGLQITDSRLPVMMTGQIFFSPDKPRFWPVKWWILIIFFCLRNIQLCWQ